MMLNLVTEWLHCFFPAHSWLDVINIEWRLLCSLLCLLWPDPVSVHAVSSLLNHWRCCTRCCIHLYNPDKTRIITCVEGVWSSIGKCHNPDRFHTCSGICRVSRLFALADFFQRFFGLVWVRKWRCGSQSTPHKGCKHALLILGLDQTRPNSSTSPWPTAGLQQDSATQKLWLVKVLLNPRLNSYNHPTLMLLCS